MAVKPAGIDTEQNYVTVTLCIVTDVPRFVCLSVGQSVSLLDTLVNPAEAAGQIEMPIGMSTRLDPRIHSMDWMGFRSSTRKEIFRGRRRDFFARYRRFDTQQSGVTFNFSPPGAVCDLLTDRLQRRRSRKIISWVGKVSFITKTQLSANLANEYTRCL